jgi:protein involved in polysaccharide export with SLBB domain
VRGILLALLVTSCGPAPVRRITAPHAPKVDATLGPGDLFDIRVFEEPDLSGSYRVDADGIIDYPLVGRVKVQGLQPGELAAHLREKLAAYVQHPQVSVLLKEANSKRIIVYGQVQKPGAYPFTNPMTISQAISVAGGFTAMAARERVIISRMEKNEQEVIEVNLLRIADGKAPNRFISPGDEVYVPERLF